MNYFFNRILITLISLILVSVLSFSAFHIVPGDAAVLSLGIEADQMQIDALRSQWGLDKSIPEQYFSWLKKLLSGNLGNSSRYRGASISGMISGRLPVTFSLAVFSLVLILLITIPVSLLPVWKKDSFPDSLVNTLTALGISIPGFFLGVLFIWIFGLVFRIFVPGLYVDYKTDFWGFLGCLFFPALSIAIPNAAVLIKFLRASIYKEWEKAYVRTARSKGATRRQTLSGHVLKNACLPALTVFGMIIGDVFSGSIVIEQVFSIPGIGRLLISSIASRDFIMVETLVVYIAFVVIFANTLVDIAIQIIDPRIRLGTTAENS